MFVIAHRGANRYAPQNTIAAFLKADEMKADGVETDVRITEDGQLVLCHNTTVNKTSNGRGAISRLTFDQLLNLDFGSWFGRKYTGTMIPTLSEFLEEMKTTDFRIIDIELKPIGNTGLSFVAEVLYMVEKAGLTDRLLISSFDEKILNKVKSLNPDVMVGYLYPRIGEIARKKIKAPVELAKKNGWNFLLPLSSYVTPGLITKAHRAGLCVAPWTVNDLGTVDRLISWNADGVITDYPDIMKNKINCT